MRMRSGIGMWLVVSAVVAVRTAGAQTPATAPTRGAAAGNHFRVSVNAGAQWSSDSFTGSTTKLVYAENAVVNTTYDIGRGLLFDGGVLVRIAGGFHAGVAVSSFAKGHDEAVAAAIPHPFFFNKPRPLDGVAANLERREVATHLQAAYIISPGRLDIALSAGPSWFHVEQDLVTGVTYTEAYPFDTATFAAASSARVSATRVGFNAGIDAGLRLSRHVGVGGLVRLSRATVELPLPGAAGIKSDAGGVQAAGGVRFYF